MDMYGQSTDTRTCVLVSNKKLRTRTGCQRCKQLHHKCTEDRPRCARCIKFNGTCHYPEPLIGKDGHHINTARSTSASKARLAKRKEALQQSDSPTSTGSSPPIEITVFRPAENRQRDSMDFLINQFAGMAEYMNAWCLPIASAEGTNLVRSSWATAYLPRLARRSEALSSAICCYAAHRMQLPDLAVAYYQDAVQSLRQRLFSLQNGAHLSVSEMLKMWCTTYVLSEVEGLIGQFEAITLHIQGALQLYKLLRGRLRQSAKSQELDNDMSLNIEYLIGNMAICSIKSMQLPEQVAEIPNCLTLPNQPVGTLLAHGGRCFQMMDAFRSRYPFRIQPDNERYDAYATELNAVLNSVQAHRDEILALPGSECIQSVTNSPFSPTIVFVDESLTMPFCATHIILLMMGPHLEPDLLQHTTRNAMGILLGMSTNKQTSRGKHFALIGAFLQSSAERSAFLVHCDKMYSEMGIPSFAKVRDLVERCWVHIEQRYGNRVQDLSCQLLPIMTSVSAMTEGIRVQARHSPESPNVLTVVMDRL